MKYLTILIVILCSILYACSNNIQTLNNATKLNSISYDHEGIFGLQPQILSEEQLFSLTKNQKKKFNLFFNHTNNMHLSNRVRVIEYIKQSTINFKYKQETFIASEVMKQEQGNCLSLAILTTAFVQLAGIKIGYQLIESNPVFELKNDMIIKGVHIRSKLYQQKFDYKLPSSQNKGLVIDYFPSETSRFVGNISHAELVARFYMNKAADYLLDKNYSYSYWYTLKSLEYTPNHSDGINLMAVIFNRVGLSTKAEKLYLYGIKHANKKLSLLKNYHFLLTQQGRVQEATEIHKRIVKLNDPSPFYWLGLADNAYQLHNWSEAKKFYNKAIKRDPKLSYGYYGLSKTYQSLGKLKRAHKLLIKAIKYNSNPAFDKIYQNSLIFYNQ